METAEKILKFVDDEKKTAAEEVKKWKKRRVKPVSYMLPEHVEALMDIYLSKVNQCESIIRFIKRGD